jgi:phosphoribosyl 1,2-cyclic phosphate phosphodiesterase
MIGSIMIVTILGSGTSQGVPNIGCHCSVCTSTDPLNKRFRPCLHVESASGFSILVDTPPEMRLAVIAQQVERVDAVLFTHSHADHIFGLDDLRSFNFLQDAEIPLYGEQSVLDDIRRAYQYIWTETQAGGGKPRLVLRPIEPGHKLSLDGVSVDVLRVMHGRLPITSYMFDGRVAYLTDVSEIPDVTLEKIRGVDVLLLDAVRHKPHPTHFHLDRALEVAADVGAGQTYFIHLSHDYDHHQMNAALPPHVRLGYDGLRFTA